MCPVRAELFHADRQTDMAESRLSQFCESAYKLLTERLILVTNRHRCDS